jgi:hypothetical protein
MIAKVENLEDKRPKFNFGIFKKYKKKIPVPII